MIMKMRLLPVLGITGFFSVALAGSAVAGAGGWAPAPGTYRTTETAAGAELVGPSTIVCYPQKGCLPQSSAFASVTVDRGLHRFKPLGDAQLVEQSGTMLTLFLFNRVSGSSIDGCWIIADGDFTVAQDLSSASLSTTVSGPSNCPGTPMKVSSTNVVTSKGVGGGGGGGGTGPITLNLSWTYKGVVAHARDDGMLTCASFTTVSGQDLDHATANSLGQITGVTGTLTSEFASIEKISSHQVVNGTPVDACFF
jgi:hypothetical protein